MSCRYGMWRVMTGRHMTIEFSLMEAGHTKFHPDWHFGLWKVKWRGTTADNLEEVANSVAHSSRNNHNIPQLVEDPHTEVAKKIELSERSIHHWLRKRAKKDSPSTMQKFTECSYHFIFYCTMFFYGLYILWDKSWFWETKYCWIGWPKQVSLPATFMSSLQIFQCPIILGQQSFLLVSQERLHHLKHCYIYQFLKIF
ncbi:ceramide synthase 6-like [Saccostrea cucullata]|uniref:ceramide synthase 6-like n=1 Tax=Saccostrea cuccullata TaxID=36930 RepID=UPI002ED2D233